MTDGIERIEGLVGMAFGDVAQRMVEQSAQPALALANLERWFQATGNPRVHAETLAAAPALSRVFGLLLGASQPISDSLVQNPELASLLFEPSTLTQMPSHERLATEGRQLLAAATSGSHARDRLRYLKQRWQLPIAASDLLDAHPQEVLWRALTDLADALIELTFDLIWDEQRIQRGLPERCPVAVVGFGKLGGRELNYSSDVDLAYVLEDGLDEALERECSRFCEAFGRALSDRMGRGSLFRVDLRLRPYGAAGPILRSARSFESYYTRYAEPWEIQALLRSRMLVGPEELRVRWEQMVSTTCYRPRRSEMALEELLAMRTRIEEFAEAGDIKRGPGGIRDVEFLTQIHQLLHGFEHPELHGQTTPETLRRLRDLGFLETTDTETLIAGYTLLRKVEHRLQLVGDNQTHVIPTDVHRRGVICRLTGYADLSEFDQAVHETREKIQTLYQSHLHAEPSLPPVRRTVATQFGTAAPLLTKWLDGIPESAAFYQSLAENQGSLGRTRTLLQSAPALVPAFRESIGLTEAVISGEIEEAPPGPSRINGLRADASPTHVAKVVSEEAAHEMARWVLAPGGAPQISPLIEATLLYLHGKLGCTFEIVALGSFALGDSIPSSDADLLLLVESPEQQQKAEQDAQAFVRAANELRRLGAPIAIDLRLRPDGGRGLLVRTLEGLRAYDLEGMDMWERFALGSARLVTGNPASLAVVQHAAYALPLTPERLKELAKMKRRIETERVSPPHVFRQVKLGYGGLSDIEWLVHLTEMRYPTATKAGETPNLVDRIRILGRVGLLNAVEVIQLLEARQHLMEVRVRLYLLGIAEDLVPENPDKLDRLARSMEYADGNAFLAAHRAHLESTRAIFLGTMERLRA